MAEASRPTLASVVSTLGFAALAAGATGAGPAGAGAGVGCEAPQPHKTTEHQAAALAPPPTLNLLFRIGRSSCLPRGAFDPGAAAEASAKSGAGRGARWYRAVTAISCSETPQESRRRVREKPRSGAKRRAGPSR